MMDEDRIAGAATNLGGKLKDAAGQLFGDRKTQMSGKADQVRGQVQNAYGSAKDAVRDGLGGELAELVEGRPAIALLAAVGLGYVIARLIHR